MYHRYFLVPKLYHHLIFLSPLCPLRSPCSVKSWIRGFGCDKMKARVGRDHEGPDSMAALRSTHILRGPRIKPRAWSHAGMRARFQDPALLSRCTLTLPRGLRAFVTIERPKPQLRLPRALKVVEGPDTDQEVAVSIPSSCKVA